MRRGGKFKKIFITLLMVSVLAAVPGLNTGSGALIEYIEPGQVPLAPLAVENVIGTAQAAFSEGPDIQTADLRGGSITLNTNLMQKGILGIRVDEESGQKLKLKVALQDQAVYYDILQSETIKVPMQYGNGTYRVELYRNLSGNKYTLLYGTDVETSMSDANQPFLYSNQIVNYERSQSSYPLVLQLTQDALSEMDILTACYGYVVNNISYDYDKMDIITSGYIPDIDSVLTGQKGICYDYAAVLASMLREAGLPAKLVMGYREDMDAYHAWNQVLADGRWITVDATYGAVMLQNGQSDDMAKDASLYNVEKVF